MNKKLVLAAVFAVGTGAVAFLESTSADAVTRQDIVESNSSEAIREGGQDCALTYTRTACPGKEAESFSKCDGKATCSKSVSASSEDECRTAAVAACANDRTQITKSKVITAKYKGKALKSKSGKDDFCLDYANRATEFNQCDKK